MTFNYKKEIHRIIVIGPPGSGKSTFARKLHSLLALPLHHLDNIWWKPDGSHISREEFDYKLNRLLKEENWIIDGNYSRTYETRIKASDTVIFLDYDTNTCIEGRTERVCQKRSDSPWVEQEVDEELIKFV
ncbi:MAG: AAA family ATPase, partial [Erysipelotrichaceae bacterium]|nr:AAA family ATPase [Erysipelotrichaceae bacterium]